MKAKIIDKNGKSVGDFEFTVPSDIREDIYKKAVLAESSLFRQEKGADPMAGRRHAIHLSKRRRKFRTTYGRGAARTPKKVMWARGRQLRFVGAFAPNTVGGRKAHAPKAEKNIVKFVNNKEWIKAMQTGIMASLNRNIVLANGQKVPENYPFVLDKSFEEISRTVEIESILLDLGFQDEMERTESRKVRAGKGTMRNRTYQNKRGPVFVVSNIEAPIVKAARKLKGFDIITPEVLFVSDFGMSEKPGRAILFTETAAKEFMEELNK